MRRAIGPVLGLLLLLEIGVAIVIVLATPGGFGSLASFGFGPERRQEQPVQTFEINGQSANLVIGNGAGKVTIEGNPSATAITINATKIGYGFDDKVFAELPYQVTQNGNTININAEREVKPNIGISGRIEIRVVAPANVAASVKTGSSDVRVSGLENKQQDFNFETGSGSLVVNNLAGNNLRLKSGSGDIRLISLTSTGINAETSSGSISLSDGQSGATRLHTGSGDIRLDRLSSGLDAETGSGSIQVQNSSVTTLRLKTGSGDVRYSGDAKLTSDGQATTGSGSVELNFTNLGNSAPRFDVSTGSGSINFNVRGVNIERNEKHHLTTNNNGPMLRINTGSGDVRVNG